MSLIKQLAPDFYVAGQLYPEHKSEVGKLGIGIIFCNRPDDEGGFDQPLHQDIEEALQVPLIYQPITEISMREIELFHQYRQDNTVPTLAYCKSGMRSTMLWVAEAVLINKTPRQEAINKALALGYPLENFLLGY